MSSVKPFDFHYLSQVARQADISAYLASAIALGCLGGVVAGKLEQKDLGWLLSGMGVGATVAARTSLKTSQDTKYILQDYEDISAQARTNQVFQELQEVPVEVPEVNWSILAGAAMPTSILGDRQGSLQIAEYLAATFGGTSLLVSDVQEGIRVSQQVSPGSYESLCTLQDVLSYAINPTYDVLIDTLDNHLATRRADSTIRQRLVFILDNPPRLPDTRHCASLNVFYVVLGAAKGWQEVLVGSEAYQYAQQRTSSPYWQEVKKRWDKLGHYPVLVNSQYARLPQV